jgi:Ca-activated chloride channel family protein
MTQLNLTPRHPALLTGFDNQLDILVRLEAPLPTEESPTRSDLNLAIVLDRSGSMSGRPLAEARRCASYLVDKLGPQDRVSIVAYDDVAEVILPSTLVTRRTRFHEAIRSIESRGMTDLHSGWLKGAEQVSAHLADDRVSRVILLSDGQANRGIVDSNEIARQCTDLAGAGVSTSTYGLGKGFNEELMVAMGQAGQGNSYYGQTAEDLMDPFQEEFDLLAALCARKLRFRVSAPDGIRVEGLNRYAQDADGAFRVPDLAFGGEAWAVFRLHIPKALIPETGDSQLSVLSLSCSYMDLDGGSHTLEPMDLTLPSLPAAAWNAVAEDQDVAARVAELAAASIQDQAQQAARRGDWNRVQVLLAEARSNAKNNKWLGQVVDTLERLARKRDRAVFAKETTYASSKMRSRLTPSDHLPASPSFVRKSSREREIATALERSGCPSRDREGPCLLPWLESASSTSPVCSRGPMPRCTWRIWVRMWSRWSTPPQATIPAASGHPLPTV